VHWAIFDNDSGDVSPLPGEESLRVPAVATADYLVATLQGSRGDAVSVYVSRKQSESRVIGVEHHFTPLGRDR
jgi:hypothetical protein